MNAMHWSGIRDSNSRPRPWQGRALPTELIPRCVLREAKVYPRFFELWRPGSESNRRARICSPLHNHSATRPVTRGWPQEPSDKTKPRWAGVSSTPLKQLHFNCALKLGAGKETCTRTLSRCFPNTFFAEVASEDLNCSLVFRPRQQVRPKKSNDVQRRALRTGAAFGNIAIRTASNSPHQFSASTSNAMPTS